MKGSNSLLDWVVKLIFGLMLAPFFFQLALYLLCAIAQAISVVLFWLAGLALLMTIVAGVSTGLALRRRLPPKKRNELPPNSPPVRRPRGRGQDDED